LSKGIKGGPHLRREESLRKAQANVWVKQSQKEKRVEKEGGGPPWAGKKNKKKNRSQAIRKAFRTGARKELDDD